MKKVSTLEKSSTSPSKILHSVRMWMKFVGLFAVIAILGSFYNATLRVKLSYFMWLASNTYLFAYNMAKREYSEAAIFFANMITTFIGVKNTYKDPYWFKPRK